METGDKIHDTRDRKLETGNYVYKGDKRLETRGRSQET